MLSGVSMCIGQQLKGTQARLEEGLSVSGARGDGQSPGNGQRWCGMKWGWYFPSWRRQH